MISFGAALGLTLVLTSVLRDLGWRVGLVDVPDGKRRCHSRPIPRVGGIAVFISIGTAALAIAYWLLRNGDVSTNADQIVPLLGGAVVFGIGLWDDARELRARTKFVVELLVALALFAVGLRIDSLGTLAGVGLLPLPVSMLLTVLWIVGVTNALNLLDGSDGVAAGTAALAALTFAVAFGLSGNGGATIVAAVVAGASIGFLVFNLPPASAFLGDSGSLALGYTLSVLGILWTKEAETFASALVPIVALGLPLLDTSTVMARRFLRGQPIFSPDRGHIHHRLQDLGCSPRQVVGVTYSVALGFGVLALLLIPLGGSAPVLVVFALFAYLVGRGLASLDYPEIREVCRSFHQATPRRSIIATNLRVQDASIRLRRAESIRDVLACLETAFHGSQFRRVELRLGEEFVPLIDTAPHHNGNGAVRPGLMRYGGGVAWSWIGREESVLESSWELRLPLEDDSGRGFGVLILVRASTTALRLADVPLIVRYLQPELRRSLTRLHERLATAAASAGENQRSGAAVIAQATVSHG